MRIVDWPFCSTRTRFEPSYAVSAPAFGRAPHEHMSPFWMAELGLPDAFEDRRREIEAVLADIEGVAIVEAFDSRCPRPRALAKGAAIPALTISAMDEAARSVTVTGTAGDIITKGDPLAVTAGGVRHYFKARADLTLTGNADTLPVFIRPRLTVSGVSLVVERDKPRCRFILDSTNVSNVTERKVTATTISLIEYWGAA